MGRKHAGIVGIVVALVAGVGLLGTSSLPAQASADGCAAGMRSDFNGDGYTDTVIADPYATVNGLAQAGRVVVLYGDSDGRIGEGARGAVSQGAASVAGTAETGDRFGWSVAVADLDCDTYTDLVVGSPFEDISGAADSGYVQVIWGAASGLGTGDASIQYTQASFGRTVTAGDQFGYAVDALEDVGQGGTPDPDAYALAIGGPGMDVDGQNDAGWVGFRVAYDGGNVPIQVTQNSPGVAGSAEAGDRFGSTISLNYVRGQSGTVDAVIGTPYEDIGALTDAGAITVLTDVYFDDVFDGVGYDQNSAGIPGSAEAGDQFGKSLDTVKVGGTSRIAVGVPYEDLGSAVNAGAVQLFSSNAVTLTPGVLLSQDTAGVTGVSETGDAFGSRVAFIAPGLGDPIARLAVGVPTEDGPAVDSGAVQVFPITDLDAEVSYDQNSVGVPGVATATDRFGTNVAFVAGVSERALIIGVPTDVDRDTGMVNIIPLGGGAPRYWAPGFGGIPLAGSARFGDPLGSVNGGTT